MIGLIKGTIYSKNINKFIILCNNGVGYEILTTIKVVSKISVGEDIVVYTYLHVREDKQQLYGFLSETDKSWFEKLIDVSSVGPVSALDIMNGVNFDEFFKIVEDGDVDSLIKIKGIGKKTAQKIIIEFSGKLKLEKECFNVNKGNSKVIELNQALRNLGFSGREINDMIAKMSTEDIDTKTIEDLILNCLKNK